MVCVANQFLIGLVIAGIFQFQRRLDSCTVPQPKEDPQADAQHAHADHNDNNLRVI